MLRDAFRIAAVVSVTLPLLASPALAGKGKGRDKVVVVRDDGKKIVFVEDDRRVYRNWWVDTYGRGNCPPGLAKKNNGCLPPGQVRRRYSVGRALPRAVVVQEVPKGLLSRLRGAPYGYKYVMVDGDVLLVQTSSGRIADAIWNVFD